MFARFLTSSVTTAFALALALAVRMPLAQWSHLTVADWVRGTAAIVLASTLVGGVAVVCSLGRKRDRFGRLRKTDTTDVADIAPFI